MYVVTRIRIVEVSLRREYQDPAGQIRRAEGSGCRLTNVSRFSKS